MAAVDLTGREVVKRRSSLHRLKVKIAEFPEERHGGKAYPAFPLSVTTLARPKLAFSMRNSFRGYRGKRPTMMPIGLKSKMAYFEHISGEAKYVFK
jgi:hypothetical protein